MINQEQPREYPPKQTLYIQNINQKIKPKDVKYALFNLFQAFGQVLQIVCKRSDRMRGQAFVVFREVGEATAAKNNLNGYPIFGKPMVDIELNLENTLRSQEKQNSLIRLKMMRNQMFIVIKYIQRSKKRNLVLLKDFSTASRIQSVQSAIFRRITVSIYNYENILLFYLFQQNFMQNFSTHAPQKESIPQWSGNRSKKFTGGRAHNNHPKDQLDTILTSSKAPEQRNIGKKQFQRHESNPQQSNKTQLKTFEIKYQKSKIFEIEELEKLIKIPFQSNRTEQELFNRQLETLGKSKIKTQPKQSNQKGIYKSGLKAQSNSTNFLNNH